MRKRRQIGSLVLFWIYCVAFRIAVAEISSGRIKGRDEPQLVSWKVLEGITEPFGTSVENSIPVWKQMKAAADQKAANMAMQQALHEYGQILRHPYVFGEMPSEERYDVFLSMAKLLKVMGFHQRAEIMLHEAMTHTSNAYEANFQLGLLFLDKEDLESAKMYLKNCLFYQESDLLILSYLTMILVTEGKIHEATFFLSRIILGLEERVRKLSFILSESEIQAMQAKMDYKLLANWLEDTIVKVFYGEFHITPSATIEALKYFSNLYQWIQSGEMNGRFVFDLGQSLHEGGRSKVGLLMMKRGFETSNPEEEGIVSHEIVRLRLAFEYPVIPHSLLDVIEAYLNITTFLSQTSKNYTRIDIENVMDMYWPIPLLGWSGLPIMPVLRELLWRFSNPFERSDDWAKEWLDPANLLELETIFLQDYYLPRKKLIKQHEFASAHRDRPNRAGSSTSDIEGIDLEEEIADYEDLLLESQQEMKKPASSPSSSAQRHQKQRKVVVPPKSSDLLHSHPVIEIGLFGGHFNNHPVGQMVLHNILDHLLSGETISSSSSSSNRGQSKTGKASSSSSSLPIRITLISLPLNPDVITRQIASKVHRIVNIPMDTRQAMQIVQDLQLDILLFPDWQPFPDQQSLVFQSIRLAPVQICFYVRGTSCASNMIDYYLLPEELENFYLQAVPAAASNAIRKSINHAQVSALPSALLNRSDNAQSAGTGAPSRMLGRPLRPAWREVFLEQVILVSDWPLLTSASIDSFLHFIQKDSSAQAPLQTEKQPSSRKASGSSGVGRSSASSSSSASSVSDLTGSLTSLAIMEDYFSPNEYEGKIFFKDQPVAILPIYPYYLHPLMDEFLFKLLRTVPVLQILVVIPDSFFAHIKDSRYKLSWAKQLIRRLWDKGGNTLSHRIRLLPSTFSDYRMVQLIRQTDLVLDTFPIGFPSSFLGLALSVGTPVITLATGAVLATSKEDKNEIKQYLQHSFHYYGWYKDHPLRMLMNHQLDIPWIPSVSNIAGFYHRVGLSSFLVTNSTHEYFEYAVKLLSDREYAYELRVKLLDALDVDVNRDNWERKTSSSSSSSDSSPDNTSVRGLRRVLYSLGLPWAYAREEKVISQILRKRKKKKDSSFDDFLQAPPVGVILH